MSELFQLDSVSTGDLALRLFLSAAAGLILGLDRDIKHKPVDFRAYMIVCIASCLLAIMAMEIPHTMAEQEHIVQIDPNRIVQGVLTGIGFLGAGAIIRKPDDTGVIGTATGASIWASGILGLAIGFGYYGLSLLAFFVIAVTLIALGSLTRKAARLGKNGDTIGR